jgi:hypothetical protein
MPVSRDVADVQAFFAQTPALEAEAVHEVSAP